MNFFQWPMLVVLTVFIPGTNANTDYSTLESLCIAILVLFIIWIIVIIILICVCKSYINKAPYLNSDSEESSAGQTNVAYVRENEEAIYRRKSSPRVYPSPHHSRPAQLQDTASQTEPYYLDPLGPSVAIQTDDVSSHF